MISWQYVRNLNEIDEAIRTKDENWCGVTAENIFSITYDSNHGCYVVFWKDDED